MVMATRSMPEFENEAQTDLYSVRRELALVGQTQFIQSLEEGYARSLSSDEAAVVAAEAHEILEALKASKKKKSTKSTTIETRKPNTKAETGYGAKDGAVPEPESETSAKKDKGKARERNESDTDESGDFGNESADKKSVEDKPSGKSAIPSDDDTSSSSSSDDDDLSPRGKEKIHGRTPRIESSGKSSKKLFKMEPPAKYTGEKDSEMSYDAVMLFLSQLSRYFRLATHINLKKDVTEYVLGFLDGFAYKWLESLDKGDKSFTWRKFERKFREKFIPPEHFQIAIDKYLAIKQGKRPVKEYMVEKEMLENTLGRRIHSDLMESSFRRGLHEEMRKAMVLFRDLPFKEYKRKAEIIDRDMKERKVGPYALDPSSDPRKSKQSSKPNEKPANNPAKPTKTNKSTKKDNELTRNQMRKEGLCFTCKEKGHVADDCPQKKAESKTIENNSIRIATAPPPRPQRKAISSKNDGRSYRDVLASTPKDKDALLKIVVPTIAIQNVDPPKHEPPPMFTTILINSVPAKVLIDSGASDNFLGTHFATTNRVSVKRSEAPLAIQQAIRGSKPKSNATAVVNVKMGDWTLRMKSYVAGLAGYDAIIGVPTLEAGAAIIDVRNRKVHFQKWDVTFDCTIPSEAPKRPRFKKRGPKRRAGKNGSVGKNGDLDREIPELVPIDPEPAGAMETLAQVAVTVATIETGTRLFLFVNPPI